MTGYHNVDLKKMILILIERYPGIRPIDLERKLVKVDDKSKPWCSRNTLYNKLKGFVKDDLIEVERKPGTKESRYYLKGRRPEPVLASTPSQFDRFVIEECERTLRGMIELGLIFYEPQSDGIYIPDLAGDPDQLKGLAIEGKVLSTYRLIEVWEGMREINITRPWRKEVDDHYLGLGPDRIRTIEKDVGIEVRYPTFTEWFYLLTNAIDQISRFAIKK